MEMQQWGFKKLLYFTHVRTSFSVLKRESGLRKLEWGMNSGKLKRRVGQQPNQIGED